MIRVQSFVADFWAEACQSMVQNACRLIRAAGEPVTTNNILQVIQSVPQYQSDIEDQDWRSKSFCWRCLEKIASEVPATKEAGELADYFAIKVPKLNFATLQMLEESITGVLRGAAIDK